MMKNAFNTLQQSYEEIGKHLQRIKKIKSFMHRYNWKGINYPSIKDDWTEFEKHNPTIALNVLYVKINIYLPYISKHDSNNEKQIIFYRFRTEMDDIILQ